MADYIAEYNKDLVVLRVFTTPTGIPQPSPATILLNTTVDTPNQTYSWGATYRKTTFTDSNGASINIPAFFGQPLSAKVSEEQKQSFSIDVTFPYGQVIGGNTLYSKELAVLYPRAESINTLDYVSKSSSGSISTDVKPFFTISDLIPNYLYRVDIVDQNDIDIITELNSYYTGTSTLEDVDKVINKASKEHYWCYLSDYTLNKVNKDSTITFTFIDIGYKLNNSWNDLKIPESTFMEWANTQTDKAYLFSTAVSAAITAEQEISFFDGWSVTGYLLAVMYYSYLFPAYSLDTDLVLSRAVVGSNAVYSLTYNTKTVDILIIPISVESINIPISSKYPFNDPLVSNGFYNEVPPFQSMMDTINNLSNLIGFFWVFDRNNAWDEIQQDCLLRVTSAYYEVPSTEYTLTGANIIDSTYDFDDSNLKNNISVLGRPYGLDLQYGANLIVTNSVNLFGYKNFVLESPLILSSSSAEAIAKNIASTYAFNIGSVVVNLPYTENIIMHTPIVLDIDSTYTTSDVPLYVSNRSINMERFKKSTMSINLVPKTERTIIDFGAPLTNLSDTADAANSIGFNFLDRAVPTDCTKLNNSSNVVSNLSLRLGYGHSSYGAWDWGVDTHYFTRRVKSGDSLTFKISYYDKSQTLVTLELFSYTYSDLSALGEVFNIAVTITYSTSSSFYVSVAWKYKKGYLVYTGPRSVSNTFSADLESGISHWFEADDSSSGDVYYVPYELSSANKFYATFEMTGGTDYGLVEGGFMVIPVSPVYRRDSIPFKGMSLDSGALITEGFMLENYSLDAVMRDLNYYITTGFEVSDSGDLITYGAVTNVAGIDPKNSRSSISSSVKTGLYLYLHEDNPEFTISFTPFMDTDLGRLAYSNVMLLVPFIKATVSEGSGQVMKVIPKTPIFILHATLPALDADKINFQYKSGESYLEYTDGEQVKRYEVSKQDEGSQVDVGDNIDDAYSLTNRSTMCNTTFQYKSKFPFLLRLALNKGTTDLWGGVIKYSDIEKQLFLYYTKLLRESTSYTETTIYPFTDLEGVVKWISDNLGNGKRLSLVPFVEPFYMYGLSDVIDNPNRSNSKDRLKLTSYLTASSTNTTFNPLSTATFLNAERDRYVVNASLESSKIADILILDYNRSNFEG